MNRVWGGHRLVGRDVSALGATIHTHTHGTRDMQVKYLQVNADDETANTSCRQ